MTNTVIKILIIVQMKTRPFKMMCTRRHDDITIENYSSAYFILSEPSMILG